MNDRATFELVQWAESLKGKDLLKLPETVREAVICEQARMEEYRREAKRDLEIINKFPVGLTFLDDTGRECNVRKHVIDRNGYSVDVHVKGLGMDNFPSSILNDMKV